MAKPKEVSCEQLVKLFEVQNLLPPAAPSADQGIQPCSHPNRAVLESMTSAELLDGIIVGIEKMEGQKQ